MVAVKVREEHPVDALRRQAGNAVPPAALERPLHDAAADVEQVRASVVDNSDAGTSPIRIRHRRSRAEHYDLCLRTGKHRCEGRAQGTSRRLAAASSSPPSTSRPPAPYEISPLADTPTRSPVH